MERKLPELVVFLQDSNRQVLMDIFTDGETCSSENCDLNHHNIYFLLNYELDNSAELDNRELQVSESTLESSEGIVKQLESRKLLMEDEADTDAEVETDDAISFNHCFPKQQSLDGELADQKDNQDQEMKPVLMDSKVVSNEACCEKSNRPEPVFRGGPEPNSKDEKSSSTEDGTPRSLASLFASQNTEEHPKHEDSKLTVVSASKQCQDNLSVRSSSTNSTQSFAFPVLTTEWTSSPARMVDAKKRDFKRRSCCWRMCFGFCRI